MAKVITLGEVKKHNSDKSVWMVIHNDVYDVTSFLEEHPGGPESLLEVAGEDATGPFEDVGHSADARELLKKYKIGTLPPSERTKDVDSCCRVKSKWKKSRSETVCVPCEALSTGHGKESKESKSWRTYDGSSGSRHVTPKSNYKPPTSPRVEKRVQTIVVPRERRRGRPPAHPPRPRF
ncbi:cytochrome b5 type B-like isoform X2 [Manduca sexta]|uniref:cytochrome b5 type B-like isoform X2 n=1 Tax=Manduca sexta TaxID=7130 RepID=UPI0018908F0D|nr:cytochrome b5 type B-like isoform X2 [Manduca sexta]